MNRLIKFSDALCHPVSAQRPAWREMDLGTGQGNNLQRLAAHSLEVTSAQWIKCAKS